MARAHNQGVILTRDGPQMINQLDGLGAVQNLFAQLLATGACVTAPNPLDNTSLRQGLDGSGEYTSGLAHAFRADLLGTDGTKSFDEVMAGTASLISDGDFTSGAGAWTSIGTANFSDGKANLPNATDIVERLFPIETGHFYQVTFDSAGEANVQIYLGTDSGSVKESFATFPRVSGTKSAILRAHSNFEGIRFRHGGGSADEIDNISVKPLPSTLNAVSPTVAAAPVYTDGMPTFDGVDDRVVFTGTLPSAVTVSAIVKTTNPQGAIFDRSPTGTGTFRAYFLSGAGSGAVIVPSSEEIRAGGLVLIDPTRGELHSVVATGEPVLFQVSNADAQAAGGLTYGGFFDGNSNWAFEGNLIPLPILDDTHENYAEALTLLNQFAQQIITEKGL